MKKIYVRLATVLLGIVALYGAIWVFNHVNAWLGIMAGLIVVYDITKLIVQLLKTKQENEK